MEKQISACKRNLPELHVPETEEKHPENDPNHANKRQKKFPEEDLICPITLELPWDPVMAEDGRIYDRTAIQEHFKNQGVRSPMTNVEMGNRLVPAPQIKNIIGRLVENGMVDGDLASKWNEKVDEQKAMMDLLKMAEGGDADAMYRVAVCHISGTDGFKQDDMVANAWCKKAHHAGSIKGTALLGSMCVGVAEHQADGMMYLGIAAAQGSNYAAYFLGRAKADGYFGVSVNKEEAIYWLEKAVGDCPFDHLMHENNIYQKDAARALLNVLKSAASTFQVSHS
jgi:U-box domain/Sel1 repeat